MKKTNILSLLSIVCIFSFFLTSCHRVSIPSDVMEEEKMAEFLQRAYLLEGFYAVETQFRYDTLQPEMIASFDSLFSEFGITRDEFEQSVDWYSQHSEVYSRVHDTVIARLDRMN